MFIQLYVFFTQLQKAFKKFEKKKLKLEKFHTCGLMEFFFTDFSMSDFLLKYFLWNLKLSIPFDIYFICCFFNGWLTTTILWGKLSHTEIIVGSIVFILTRCQPDPSFSYLNAFRIEQIFNYSEIHWRILLFSVSLAFFRKR